MSLITKIHSYIRRPHLSRNSQSTTSYDSHKVYARMPTVLLPKGDSPLMSLGSALDARASFNKEDYTGQLVSLSKIGQLLWHSLGKRSDSELRRYPSGGGLYPIETYVLGHIEGKGNFAYHYNPTKHALEQLWSVEENVIEKLATSPDTPSSDLFVVFTSVWDRSAVRYGDLAYSHSLLEGGHMAQNILLVATALGIKSRPVSGFDDELVCEILDLNPKKEQPIYGIFLAS